MLYIIGLGNPGTRYRETRHNVGFLFLDYYNEHFCKAKVHSPEDYHYFSGSIADQKAIFIKPQTYMNCSGDIIPRVRKKFGPPDSIIVIYDDVALSVGRMRIRKDGSSGGHNGMQSLINALGTQAIGRIRIGISAPDVMDMKDYVLSRITPDEKKILTELFEYTAQALREIVLNGYDRAMASFNGIAISE